MVRPIYVPQAGRVIEFSDAATDDQIQAYIQTNYMKPAPAPAPVQPQAERSLSGALSSGVSGLLGSAQATTGAIAGGVEDLIGADKDVSNYFFDLAREDFADAAKYQGGDIWGAETWGDMGYSTLEGIAQFLPQTALTAGLTMIPVAGVPLALGASTYLTTGQHAARQAQEQNIDIKDADYKWAAMTAVPSAALETLGGMALARGIPQGLVSSYVGRMVGRAASTGVGKTATVAGSEALTETGQQAIEILQANPEKLYEFSPETQKELLNAATLGGLTGGALYTAFGPLESYVNTKRAEAATQLKADTGVKADEGRAQARRAEIESGVQAMIDAKVDGPVDVSALRIARDETDPNSPQIDVTRLYSKGTPLVDFSDRSVAEETINEYKARTNANIAISTGEVGDYFGKSPKVTLEEKSTPLSSPKSRVAERIRERQAQAPFKGGLSGVIKQGPNADKAVAVGDKFVPLDEIKSQYEALSQDQGTRNKILKTPERLEATSMRVGLPPSDLRAELKDANRESAPVIKEMKPAYQDISTRVPQNTITMGVEETIRPGEAVWSNADSDVPVEVTSDPAERSDSGELYRKIRDKDGNSTYVPESQLRMAAPRPEPISLKPTPSKPVVGQTKSFPKRKGLSYEALNKFSMGSKFEPLTEQQMRQLEGVETGYDLQQQPGTLQGRASQGEATLDTEAALPKIQTTPWDRVNASAPARASGDLSTTVNIAGRAAPKVTAAYQAKADKMADVIGSAVAERVKRFGTPDFAVKLKDVITGKGLPSALRDRRTPQGRAALRDSDNGPEVIIELATGIYDPNLTVEQLTAKVIEILNHEAIHGFYSAGLITPAEQRILARATRETKLKDRKYSYYDMASRTYQPMYMRDVLEGRMTAEEVDAIVEEEAVAEMFREWAKNPSSVPVQARPFLNRILQFIKSLFSGFKTAQQNEIFRKIESGEIGARQRDFGATTKDRSRMAINPDFLRDAPSYAETPEEGKRRTENFIPDNMNASQSEKAFKRLNEANARFPNPLMNANQWTNNLAFAYNKSSGLLMPPKWGISMVNDVNSWANWMKGLTSSQLSGVDQGFASIDQISAAYKSGKTTPEFTGTLLFWTYLSRMASSFPHESGFLDAAEAASPFIQKAVEGRFTADPELLAMTSTGEGAKALKQNAGFDPDSLPADIAVAGRSDLDDWFLMARRVIPGDSPGNSVTNNINSFGRDFLSSMSTTAPGQNISKLQAVHNLFAGDVNGPELRRQFHRIRDGASLGFDNKILSFAILLSGRKDVLVMDRIQINQLFGGGQTNKIYDDVATLFNGPRGLAVYEALERGLTTKIAELYSAAGRPNDASLGRYHWESWIRSSGQIVAHPTLQALVNLSNRKANPFIGIASAEGRYHRGMFGVQYMKMPNGRTEFIYTAANGNEYAVQKNDLDRILKKDTLLKMGAIPRWFPGVSDFEGGVSSWKDYPGVDIAKIDNEIARNGVLVRNGRANQTTGASANGGQAADVARLARARIAHDAANRIRWDFGRRPIDGKPNDRIPEPYERTDRRSASGDVIATYTPKGEVKRILDDVKVSAPDFLELSQTKENAAKFRAAISDAKKENSHGAAVYVYDEADYVGMRLFTTEDQGAGFALKGNDIVSVFNRSSSPYKGVSIPIVQLAIQLGGRKLDGFDTVLPNLYAQGGMTVVARTKFSDLDGIKPSDWDENTFVNFNGGKPDVVFMVFNPSNWSIYKPTDGHLFTSTAQDPYAAAEEAYNSAVDAQSKAVYTEPEPKEKAPRKGKVSARDRFALAPPVDSADFKAWFGNGSVVESDGKPKVLYHATRSKFKAFDTKRSELGSHFGTPEQANTFVYKDPEMATDEGYVDEYLMEPESNTHQIFPVYVSLQKPLRMKDMGNWVADSVTDQLVEMGIATKEQADQVYNLYYNRGNTQTRRQSIQMMQELIKNAGYDGVVYLNRHEAVNKPNLYDRMEADGREAVDIRTLTDDEIRKYAPDAKDSYIVFEPEQVKSAFNEFPEGEAYRTNFSLSPSHPEAPSTPYVEAQRDRVYRTDVTDSLATRINKYFFGEGYQPGTLGAALKIHFFDTYDRLRQMEGADIKAEYSAFTDFHMAERASHFAAAAASSGNFEIDTIAGDPRSMTVRVVENEDNIQNIFNILQDGPVGPDGKKQVLTNKFFDYAIAQRATRLEADGKETPVDARWRQEALAEGARTPQIMEAYAMYQRYNRRLMEAAHKAGAITQDEFHSFTKDMDYFSFYREYGDRSMIPGVGKKAANDWGIVPYKGSTLGNLVNDPLVMMIHNTNFWTGAIMKTIASRKAFLNLSDIGEAVQLAPNAMPDVNAGWQPEVMYYKSGGETYRFAVKDYLLTKALGSTPDFNAPKWLELFGLSTKTLREAITRDPVFIARNLMRDTVSTWGLTGENIIPVLDTLRGWRSAVKNDASMRALVMRGVTGGFDEASKGAEGIANRIRNEGTIRDKITYIKNPKEAAMAMWRLMGKASDTSDAATRIAVYEKALSEGATEYQAAWRALKIMNFSRHGAFGAIRYLTLMYPFINARLQGTDILLTGLGAAGRVALGKARNEPEANLGKRVLFRGAIFAGLSIALEALNSEDEEYRELPDYKKDSNLLIPIGGGQYFAWPQPFEFGVLFSTIPRHIYHHWNGDGDLRKTVNLFTTQFASTFGLNPLPQLLQPAYEVYSNKSSFTGRPLISEGMARLDPSLQYTDKTSKLARILGEVPINYNNVTGQFEGVSPIMIDHLITGYGGPLASYLLAATDAISADLGPQQVPYMSLTQYPVIRSFITDAKTTSPQSVADTYELYTMVDQVNRTFSRFAAMGDADAALKYAEENLGILMYKKQITQMVGALDGLRAQRRVIERNKDMTDAEKVTALQELRDLEKQLTANIKELNAALR